MQGTVYGIRFSMLVPRMRDFRIFAKQEVCVLVGNDVWLGNSYLAVWFPRIYNLSEDNVSSIANMGVWDSFFGIWNFR